jgi:3-oxoacyl-[acyl-carrier protein] reductase
LFVELVSKGHLVFGYDYKNGDDVLYPRVEHLEQLDCLINCAAINRINWLEDVTEAEWDSVIDVNLKGAFLMTQACLPMLKESKGVVVNIVSNASHVPLTSSAAYNASKGGLDILTKQFARELTKRYGITVFGISPNKLKGTGMSSDIERQVERVRGWTPEQAAAYQAAALLTGLETPPERVAEFLAFLLSDRERCRYLTGTILPYGA